MSRIRMGNVAGVSLALLLAGTAILEAQGGKPRVPNRIGAPGQAATGQAATAEQSPAARTTQDVKALLPCCVLQRVEPVSGLRNAAAGGMRKSAFLVLKDTRTGKLHRMEVSGASANKYRPGQAVDLNIEKTALAITPFPVEEYRRQRINGKSSWIMKSWVTVSNNGRLDGKTNIKSSEAMRGFTGGVEVLLTDRAGNVLYQSKLRTYGVNGTAMGGKSERTENWNETVPADALNKVRAVVVHHSYEPKVRLAAGIGWIKDNWKVVRKVYKCGKQLYDTATATEDRQAPPPPPPPPGQPTSQSQPPASDDSLMECIEVTEELAEQLGY